MNHRFSFLLVGALIGIISLAGALFLYREFHKTESVDDQAVFKNAIGYSDEDVKYPYTTGVQVDYPFLVVEPIAYEKGIIPLIMPSSGLALCQNKNLESRLVNAILTVRVVDSRIAPSNVSEQVSITGCDLSNGEKPLFFIVDKTKHLKPGRVPSFKIPEDKFGPEDWGTNFVFNNIHYQLKRDKFNENIQARTTLIAGDKEQVIEGNKVRGNQVSKVFIKWVGDLDGDGKLDIYANTEFLEDDHPDVLFLSSFARKGELVRKVSETNTPAGC